MNFLECVPPERIEKIDSEKVLPHPEEVLIMADKYKSPELCNYYCSNQCPIGQQYVPEIKMKELPHIKEELEKISVNVETLQLWSERMLASGAIDEDAYNKRKL